jgi:hypothetical protein
LIKITAKTLKFNSKSIKLQKSVMFKKIAPQFRKVLYKWTPQQAKLLHGLKNFKPWVWQIPNSVILPLVPFILCCVLG